MVLYDGRPNGELMMATGSVQTKNPADYLTIEVDDCLRPLSNAINVHSLRVRWHVTPSAFTHGTPTRVCCSLNFLLAAVMCLLLHHRLHSWQQTGCGRASEKYWTAWALTPRKSFQCQRTACHSSCCRTCACHACRMPLSLQR